MSKLEKKVALVTGGSRSTCRALGRAAGRGDQG